MEDKGLIFSIDAALMLIPIFILIATVSGLNLYVPHESPYYQSQDIMETLYNIGNGPSTVSLATIANNISAGNTVVATTMANNASFREILDKSFRNYNLTYQSGGDYITLVNQGSMNNVPNAASVTRTYNNVTFRLYMW